MEFLSQQYNASSHPIDLTLQSKESVANINAAGSPTFEAHQIPHHPKAGIHEYRFDWSRDAVSFYADGSLLRTMTSAEAVPSTPGHLVLQHWSTGNPDWTAGPPKTDAIMTVAYVKGYLNSSDPKRQQAWADRCKDVNAKGATCAIPETKHAPKGGKSAKTFFFGMQEGQTNNQTISAEGMKGVGNMLAPSSAVPTMVIAIDMLALCIWAL